VFIFINSIWTGSKLPNVRLITASGLGRLKAVKKLLKRKADANFQLHGGVTAIYAASEEGHLGVVKVLLSEGS